MTREEAKEILFQKVKPCVLGEWGEAVDMAIEALSAKPTHLISRADAIAQAKYLVNRWIGVTGKAYDEKVPLIEEVFNAIPSAKLPTKCIAKINIDADEIVKRIKDEYEIADRPTELLDDGTLKVNVKSGAEVNRVLIWGDDGSGGLYYADDRPSGEWAIVNKGLDIYICDQCGEVEQIQRIPIWDYCPNCGAKMGGE